MGAKAPLKTEEMSTEREVMQWAKQNLQEVQRLKEKADKAEKAQECGKDCYTIVGEVIKARRKELKMTQRQVGEEVGMHYNHVIGYEKGKRDADEVLLCSRDRAETQRCNNSMRVFSFKHLADWKSFCNFATQSKGDCLHVARKGVD